jgi:hypothetical protein
MKTNLPVTIAMLKKKKEILRVLVAEINKLGNEIELLERHKAQLQGRKRAARKLVLSEVTYDDIVSEVMEKQNGKEN